MKNFAVLFVALAVFISCRPAQPSKPVPAADGVPAGEAADLGGDADLSALLPKSPGDLAWEQVLTRLQPPPYPTEWAQREPSPEEVAKWEYGNAQLAAQAATNAAKFYADYPEHARALEAREREYSLLNIAAQLGHTNILPHLMGLEKAWLKDPALSDDRRFELRLQQLQRDVTAERKKSTEAALTRMEQGVRALEKEFPKRTEIPALLVTVAQGWAENDQPTKAIALAREAVERGDEEVKETATSLLATLERVGKPFELKVKSIDGREIDMAQMKGKVVLIDFWATWCRPCMDELPKLKETYEKLHSKGFEIIGLSLDQEKAALEEVVASEKIPWPQYLDGGKEEGSLADKFQVASIPTMWLVDKKGILRDLNARENLATKVEKFLAE